MPIGSPNVLTDCRGFFEKPATPIQRQYEALRAYFLEGLSSAEAAERFGYTPAALRMLCYEFRRVVSCQSSLPCGARDHASSPRRAKSATR
jgi:hypothetical protein